MGVGRFAAASAAAGLLGGLEVLFAGAAGRDIGCGATIAVSIGLVLWLVNMRNAMAAPARIRISAAKA
jgi:hypothetical protein